MQLYSGSLWDEFECSGYNRVGCMSCSFFFDSVKQGFVESERLGLSVEFEPLAEIVRLVEPECHVELEHLIAFEHLESLNFYRHQ